MILNNPKWKTNRIESTLKRDLFSTWFFALALCGFSMFSAYSIYQNEGVRFFERINPIFYLFVLFPIIGLWMLFKAIKDTRAWREQGEAYVVLEPCPGQVGGKVSGYIDLPFAHDSSHQLKIVLNCLRFYQEKNNNDEDGMKQELLWQGTQLLTTDTLIEGSRVYFSFEPPEKLSESKLIGEEYFEWQLRLSLPESSLSKGVTSVRLRDKRAGKNQEYRRKFIIPVMKMAFDTTQSNAYIVPQNSVINTTKEITQKNTQEATQKASQKADKNRVTEQIVNANLPEIQQVSGGRQYFYPAFHNKGFGLLMAGMGTVVGLVAWFILSGFGDFIPITILLVKIMVSLVVSVFVILGVLILGHSLRAVVSPQGVDIQYKAFGLHFSGYTDIDDIADIEVKKSLVTKSDGETDILYNINIVHANGARSTIGSGVSQYAHAKNLKQKMIADLGAKWNANIFDDKDDSTPLDSMRGKLSNNKLAVVFAIFFQKIGPPMIPAALLYDSREFLVSIFFPLL